MNDNKFTTGLLLGLILGGGAVFLLGTKTGKNLLKIVSEQGLDGLLNLLEEYNFDDLEEMEEVPEPSDAEAMDGKEEIQSDKEVNHQNSEKEELKPAPKKHFFRRVKK